MSKKCISCGTPPTPYYKGDKNSVTQNHASVYRDTAYAAGVVFPEEFVVPAIGEDVSVATTELVNVVIGSYIWSPAYGYLKIVHFDSCTGIIGLLNDDISGAAIPGTAVAAGSVWAVTARPCCADQDNFQLFPFLAEDYVIPGVGNSVTLSVTSTFGLIVGTLVRIGSNVYYLDQINSSLEIVVTNQGAGGVPGTIVSALDVNGDYQYLITSAAVSVCTSVVSNDTVKLTGCNGSVESILTGEWEGQVPVLVDPATEEVSFYLLDTEVRTCTPLTNAVNVLTATPSYTIDVADLEIAGVNAGLTKMPDGLYEVTYSVIDEATEVEYQDVKKILILCESACKIKQLASEVEVNPDCNKCQSESAIKFLEAYTLFKALMFSGACGAVSEINKNIENLHTFLINVNCKNC